ncbi:MAG: hypothetical protein ACYC3S_14510 [Chloroflexota bacterium]
MDEMVLAELKRIAHERGTTTYSDLAKLLGLDIVNRGHRTKIANSLKRISTAEYEKDRPLLSVLVVKAGSDRPGNGFFNLAASLGTYQGGDDGLAQMEFFLAELDKVYAAWQ